MTPEFARIPRSISLCLVAALIASALAIATVSRAATGDRVLINEVLVSHTGADTAEYVELYGTPGASLTGMSLVVVEGDAAPQVPGTVTFRLDFAAGSHLGGNGFFLVGNPTGLAAVYHVTPNVAIGNDAFQNGSETFALIPTASVPAVGATVTGDEVAFDTVAFSDGGPSDAFFFSAPVVGPDPSTGFFPAGGRRIVNGVDTDTPDDWAFADFALGPSNTPTPGTPFNMPIVTTCPTDMTTQEGTAASATVSATDPDGVVTGFSIVSAPDPGTISVDNVSPAPGSGGTGTASLEVGAATPAGSYAVTITASNADATPQTASCQVTVVVEPAPPPPPPGGPTLDALMAMAVGYEGSGDVTPSKAHLVDDRLARIARFLAAGQDAAYRAQLRAFANQVEGLAPRWIDQDAADAMAELARQLMAA
jgi:hypothetical protein